MKTKISTNELIINLKCMIECDVIHILNDDHDGHPSRVIPDRCLCVRERDEKSVFAHACARPSVANVRLAPRVSCPITNTMIR
jgi:hypothetical protein